MTPQLELYLISLRMQSLLDNVDIHHNGLVKSSRAINAFASKSSEILDKQLDDTLAVAIHNYHIVQDAISSEVLETPIGELSIEQK